METKPGRPRLNHAIETMRRTVVSYFVTYQGEEFDVEVEQDIDSVEIIVKERNGILITDMDTIKGITKVVDKCISEGR